MKKSFCCALVVVMCLAVVFPALGAEPTSEELYGYVEDGLYTNSMMGAQAYFGDEWRILSQKEMAANIGIARSRSSKMNELFSNMEEPSQGQIPAFCVKSKDGNNDISVAVDDLGIYAEDALSDPSAKKEYIEQATKFASDLMSQVYTKAGAKNLKVRRGNFKFMGSTRPGIVVSFKNPTSKTIYQKMVICLKGRYCFTVNATCTGHDITDILLSMFRKID